MHWHDFKANDWTDRSLKQEEHGQKVDECPKMLS